MRDIVGAQDEFEDEIKTGNSLVNMVLTQKLAAAKNKNIPVTLIADLQENIPIKEDDVCGILFNLLDNAIEASAGYEQADIRIELKIIKNYLSILIKNKTSYNILKENPNLETIKTDKENHGIGINIINDIVKRNHGILDIRMEEDYFVVSALLGLR
jgi:sensor histidine kinase regulating citrate/malate metabolism